MMATLASSRRWPFVLALLLLGGAWLASRSLSQAEPGVPMRPLAEIPSILEGRWQGEDLSLEADVLAVLRLSDYILRAYRPIPAGPASAGREGDRASNRPGAGASDLLPVWLYVGYYESQRTGATYHSPKNCLPGAGWQFVESSHVSVSLPQEPPITINRVLVEKGLDRQVILYWYQDRGRVIASEYWAKAYLMWDAMTSHRTDGAMVRISIPVQSTPDAAYRHGVAFLVDVWPKLRASLPS